MLAGGARAWVLGFLGCGCWVEEVFENRTVRLVERARIGINEASVADC